MTGRHDGADATPPARPGTSAQYAGHGLMVGTLVLLLLAATSGQVDARDRHNPWAEDRPAASDGVPERARHRFPDRDYDPSRRGPQAGAREWSGAPSRAHGHAPGAHGPGPYPYPGSYPGWPGGSGYAPWTTPGYGAPWGMSPFGGFPFP